MPYVPWREVSDWECSNCGRCCRRLKIILTNREADEIAAHFDESWVERLRVPMLGKASGRCHFQRTADGFSICLLQNTGLKPMSCRTFPFMVARQPLRGSNGPDALHPSGHLYIYANDSCPSLRTGTPSENLLLHLLPEVLDIALRGREDQVYTTSAMPRGAS